MKISLILSVLLLNSIAFAQIDCESSVRELAIISYSYGQKNLAYTAELEQRMKKTVESCISRKRIQVCANSGLGSVNNAQINLDRKIKSLQILCADDRKENCISGPFTIVSDSAERSATITSGSGVCVIVEGVKVN